MPGVGWANYYGTVWSRAWRDTVTFLKAQILFNLLGALIVAGVTYRIGADIGEPFNVKVAAYAAILAAIVVTVGVFAWNLAAAPWRLREEMAARLLVFERRPDVGPLIALRERGVHLLNSDDQWIFLEMDLRRWENETVAELEKCAARSDVSWFRVLGEFRTRVFPGLSDDVNHEKAMLAERLERLHVIIRRIEGLT